MISLTLVQQAFFLNRIHISLRIKISQGALEELNGHFELNFLNKKQDYNFRLEFNESSRTLSAASSGIWAGTHMILTKISCILFSLNSAREWAMKP